MVAQNLFSCRYRYCIGPIMGLASVWSALDFDILPSLSSCLHLRFIKRSSLVHQGDLCSLLLWVKCSAVSVSVVLLASWCHNEAGVSTGLPAILPGKLHREFKNPSRLISLRGQICHLAPGIMATFIVRKFNFTSTHPTNVPPIWFDPAVYFSSLYSLWYLLQVFSSTFVNVSFHISCYPPRLFADFKHLE